MPLDLIQLNCRRRSYERTESFTESTADLRSDDLGVVLSSRWTQSRKEFDALGQQRDPIGERDGLAATPLLREPAGSLFGVSEAGHLKEVAT